MALHLKYSLSDATLILIGMCRVYVSDSYFESIKASIARGLIALYLKYSEPQLRNFVAIVKHYVDLIVHFFHIILSFLFILLFYHRSCRCQARTPTRRRET